MFSNKNLGYLGISAILLVMLACEFSIGGTGSGNKQTPEGEDLHATAQVLITQMAQTSQARIQAMPPTAALPTLTPQPMKQPTAEVPPTIEPASPPELIQDLDINRNTFFCVKTDGPTTLTFTVEMSDIERGMAIFWRLYEKQDQSQTEWKNVSMQRKTSTSRTFTFDANAWDGTNNFFYPPGFAESWFQFQLISGDGKYRTPVYRDDVTFFPCAQ